MGGSAGSAAGASEEEFAGVEPEGAPLTGGAGGRSTGVSAGISAGVTTDVSTGSTGVSTGVSSQGAGGDQSTTDTAKDQARQVAGAGIDSGKHVASVATDQAKEVAAEAGHQAKALLDQAKSELLDHASSQQNRVAEQLHALSHELGTMASRSEEEGMATELAQEASRRIGTMAHWLEDREPGSLVDELKSFARNKPGTFLAVAAGLGLVAGRMTRGVKAGPPEDDTQALSQPGGYGGYAGSAAVTTRPATMGDEAAGTGIAPGMVSPQTADTGVYADDALVGEPLPPRTPTTGMTP